jgi:hypothetical protein
MTRHVDAETLARFRQGELNPRRSSRIQAHLAGCRRCSELNEDLASVTTLLARVQPPPIPEHLTARIQGAIAAEAAQRVALGAAAAGTALQAGTARPAGAAPAGTHIAAGAGPALPPEEARSPRPQEPPTRGRRRPRLPRLTSPVALRAAAVAAAIVVISGGIYAIVHRAGGSSTASGAGAPVAGPARRSSGSGAAAAPTFGPALPYRHAGHEDTVTPVTTDTDFTRGKLRGDVRTELAQASSARNRLTSPNSESPNAMPNSTAAPGKHRTAFGISIPVLDGCVNRVASGELVLLVDVARYQGTRAMVIVTEVSAISPEQVWVVGLGCSGSRSDVLTHEALARGG